DVDAIVDDHVGARVDAVGDQHVPDGLGNRDDADGTAPGAEASGVEFDSSGRDDAPAHGRGRYERQRVAVVDVDDVRLECCDGAAQVPPGPRIETDVPRRAEHADAVGRGAPRQLASLLGDERLLDLRFPAQFTAEAPHLVLAAA